MEVMVTRDDDLGNILIPAVDGLGNQVVSLNPILGVVPDVHRGQEGLEGRELLSDGMVTGTISLVAGEHLLTGGAPTSRVEEPDHLRRGQSPDDVDVGHDRPEECPGRDPL